MSKQKTEQHKNKMWVSRTFNAPIELVFEVHSDCNHLMNWYGGEDWPLTSCEIDFQVEGRWSYCFKNPEGPPNCSLAIFKEINKPEKIVYMEHFLDEDGKISKDLPPVLISLEFTGESGKTTIVSSWEYPSESDLNLMLEMGALEGLTAVWDRLESYLKHQ